MEKYSKEEKEKMSELYRQYKSLHVVAKLYACATSTVWYAANPEGYERHKEYVRWMSQAGKK